MQKLFSFTMFKLYLAVNILFFFCHERPTSSVFIFGKCLRQQHFYSVIFSLLIYTCKTFTDLLWYDMVKFEKTNLPVLLLMLFVFLDSLGLISHFEKFLASSPSFDKCLTVYPTYYIFIG